MTTMSAPLLNKAVSYVKEAERHGHGESFDDIEQCLRRAIQPARVAAYPCRRCVFALGRALVDFGVDIMTEAAAVSESPNLDGSEP